MKVYLNKDYEIPRKSGKKTVIKAGAVCDIIPEAAKKLIEEKKAEDVSGLKPGQLKKYLKQKGGN
jgi:hypothetical protein